jgi:dTDP-4-dehydrorhamnose reductase
MTQDALRTIIFGKGGQLGEALLGKSQAFGEIFAPTLEMVNFSRPETIIEALDQFQPTLIINAAAYTDVDSAERQQEKAMAINCDAVEVIAKASSNIEALLIHISTDYVFDGQTDKPYKESDAANPINYYGITKLASEEVVQAAANQYLIFRTSWLYAPGFSNFVTQALDWSHTQETLRVVTDQVGSPTWAGTLVNLIVQLVSNFNLSDLGKKSGLYHLAGKGQASRLEWIQNVLEIDPEKHLQKVQTLLPALSEDFPSPAARPKYSALNCDLFENTFDLSIPTWENELVSAFENYKSLR